MDCESVDNLLETIDGALHGDTSMDAMRWVPEDERTEDSLTHRASRQILPISLSIGVDSSALEDAFRRAITALNAAWPNIQRSMAEMGAAAARAFSDPGMVVDETAPRERALYLRRTRNTGPQSRGHAPRRIDPHGHR